MILTIARMVAITFFALGLHGMLSYLALPAKDFNAQHWIAFCTNALIVIIAGLVLVGFQ